METSISFQRGVLSSDVGATDAFIIVLGTDGHILYTSESIASLLGCMPTALHNTTLYEIVSDDNKSPLYHMLNMSATIDTNGQQQLKLLVQPNPLLHLCCKLFEVIDFHSRL